MTPAVIALFNIWQRWAYYLELYTAKNNFNHKECSLYALQTLFPEPSFCSNKSGHLWWCGRTWLKCIGTCINIYILILHLTSYFWQSGRNQNVPTIHHTNTTHSRYFTYLQKTTRSDLRGSEARIARDGSRSSSAAAGGQCATTRSAWTRRTLSADSWGFLEPWATSATATMETAPGWYGSMTSAALEVNLPW